MIFSLITFVLVCIFGHASIAETIVVRSGEHDGFTRLVFPLPKSTKWSLDGTGQTVSLNIEIPSIQFDYSRVFSRIPRHRLVSLSQNGPGSALLFSLGCNCTVSSFTQPPGLLVIDIREKMAPFAPAPNLVEVLLFRNPYRFDFRSFPKVSFVPETMMIPFSIGQVHRFQLPDIAVRETEAMPPLATQSTNIFEGIRSSEKRLLSQINRASAQGLLEFSADMNSTNTSRQSEIPEPSFERSQLDNRQRPTPIALSVSTSANREAPVSSKIRNTLHSNTECAKSELLDIWDWSGGQSFSLSIGENRAILYDEIGQIHSTAALNLARSFLHFGFGSEALRILQLVPQRSEERNILMALGAIMVGGGKFGISTFSGQQNCEGDAALWSVLASDNLDSDVNNDAILKTFSRLPVPLKTFLGPQISREFSNAGDREMADSILRMVGRLEGYTNSEIQLAQSVVSDLQADSETAELELKKSISAATIHSPEALVKLVMRMLDDQMFVPLELPDLVAAYSMELRNSEIGADLQRAHAISLALSGQFEKAFSTLFQSMERDEDFEAGATFASLLDLLSKRADDVTFLQLALQSGLEGRLSVPEKIGNTLARRLLDLGFPEKADIWISGIGKDELSDAQKKLRAEILLTRNLPEKVLVELAGLEGPESDRLRILALWKLKKYQQAGQILSSRDDHDGAARGFWLAEDWAAAPKMQNSFYSRIMDDSIELRQAGTEQHGSPPLATARSLMERSEETRLEVTTLLQRTPVDGVPHQ